MKNQNKNIKNTFSDIDKKWMDLALKEAEKAIEFGEIPVASILVCNDQEILRSQTMVKREGSIVAHSEIFTLNKAKDKVWTHKPLTLYSTLEPCLMCLGATLQTEVDRIVYGMNAKPDGGVRYLDNIKEKNGSSPKVQRGLFSEKSVELMKKFLTIHPESPAAPYVKKLLKHYEN